MGQSSISSAEVRHYELRYTDLFNGGRGYAFPCNAAGWVDINELSSRGRTNYLYARAVVGMALSFPRVISIA